MPDAKSVSGICGPKEGETLLGHEFAKRMIKTHGLYSDRRLKAFC